MFSPPLGLPPRTRATLTSVFGQPQPRPVEDTPEVRALCAELVPDEAPWVVKVSAPPWANPNDCTENVASVIERHGGSIEYGWQLWETLPGLMIEAEFHAVWKDEDGARLDVTPKAHPSINRIAFLPDPNLVYEGRQIDNIRRPLTDEPLIAALIQAAEDWYEATNRGDLADFHGQLTMTPELQAIMKRRLSIKAQISAKYYS
jgi:hypothetical protein